ncbi:hypothetical protein CIK05_00380 [Bdellovibrio sp. qaytius]|nr:hypothetical protein CIK05_00380 [Bdellovibrio sp. qaytius]
MKFPTKLSFAIFTTLLSLSTSAFAAGDTHTFGGGIIVMTPSQDDLDQHISDVNTANGSSLGKFGSAYELYGQYSYRFSSSMFALQFRPGYFMQSAGNYSLKGMTFFPMLKIYPLENNFIKFFLQTGLGYGTLKGDIGYANGANVSFSGGAFGAIFGLGANFCFAGSHCVGIEGNFRYLPVERNIVQSASGNATNFSAAPVASQELEINNHDVKTTMSGIQGGLSYNYMF